MGPNTEPCGTPLNTNCQSDVTPLIHTVCFLPDNQSKIHVTNLKDASYAEIIFN